MRQTRLILELNQRSLELAQRTAQGSSTGPPDSQTPNGQTLSGVDQSISTPSSQVSTVLNLCQRTLRTWEESKSLFRTSSQASTSKRPLTGPPLGEGPSKRPRLSSPIARRSSRATVNISKTFLGPSESPTTGASCVTTRPSEILSREVNRPLCSTIQSNDVTLPHSFLRSGLKLNQEAPRLERKGKGVFVDDLIMGKGVGSSVVSSRTSAASVEAPSMDEWSVLTQSKNLVIRPKYLRYNHWDLEGVSPPSVLLWSKSAEPLPDPPELPDDHPMSLTLRNHPDLFRIVTPLNVSNFRQLLIKSNHPNSAFYNSVCKGFINGFWPWANIQAEGFPLTHDEPAKGVQEKEKLDFVRRQRDVEIEKGRFSKSFGRDLFPGMYSVPTFAVPKEGSKKFRLVTDQSAGRFPVNEMTTRHEVAFPMDNLVQLGDQLLRAHRNLRPGQHLTLFKSDVAEAYRLLPVHPFWQMKQVNTVDGLRYVDRNNVFGGRRSGDLFIAFMSLVLWVATYEWRIQGLCNYVDDVFGVEISGETSWYHPYRRDLPVKQALLLECWDALGVPHKPEKQLFGETLTIIGIEIDANRLTFTMPLDRKEALLKELDRFIIRRKKGEQRKSFVLKDFQRLAGWLNWAFNVYPLLRPCLSHLYSKIGDLHRSKAPVHTNRAISRELEWAESHIKSSPGVVLLKQLDWSVQEADYIIFCDACEYGLAFWYPYLNLGFWGYAPTNTTNDIYFREGLAVVSALRDVTERQPGSSVVIYTDNQSTFDVFSSLHADPDHNSLLLYAADLQIHYNLNLRVLWTPGRINHVADALSRHKFDLAVALAPHIHLSSFNPPLDAISHPSTRP
ncbi:hypothetical protein AGABI2DRAFT_199027 [Agaricus bisporus var. bisporus H97]|uniref:hypothetical protein n=1 Tax=Agaricus bisporus var. bisporus (strain H97 / ATCC MYA-4626 / FGSC 10389) TaxID=936046 RepID=UPI00029F58A0|nr:hypothetical protein AGABI2DRAFT_199027 [Agaricus bisporus var. bisporus H97]EKV49892.1 hypothetical protein AGABI2DRAFT_199027 [Agaricus bisporus var. bisporus H97]